MTMIYLVIMYDSAPQFLVTVRRIFSHVPASMDTAYPNKTSAASLFAPLYGAVPLKMVKSLLV